MPDNPCHSCPLMAEDCADCAYLAGNCCGGYPIHEEDSEDPEAAYERGYQAGLGDKGPPAVAEVTNSWQFSVARTVIPVYAADLPMKKSAARGAERRKAITAILRQYQANDWAKIAFPNAINALLKVI